MKDVVSCHRTSLVEWVASLSIICSILCVYGLPWPALASGGLVLVVAALLVLGPSLSIRPVRAECESMLAVAMQPASRSTRRPGLLPRENRTR
jgi:hypothetical protein